MADTTEPPAKRRRFDYSETITICVGEDAKEFILHKDQACTSSKFIKAALSHDWKESQNQRIQLPEAKVASFEGYLHWLYTSHIICNLTDAINTVDFSALAELYFLGDYMNDDYFCGAVVDKMVASAYTLNRLPSSKPIKIIWKQTPPTSPLRKVVLELYIRQPITWIATILDEQPRFPKEFIVTLLQAKSARYASHRLDRLVDISELEMKQACRAFLGGTELD